MICQVDDCDRAAEKRGWCGAHYRRYQRHGQVLAAEPLRVVGDLRARLASRIEVCPWAGCWLWTGSLLPTGYGTIKANGRVQLAHRVAYEEYVAPIPRGMTLDHLCRVTHCINPDHLEVVTRRENIRRATAARRAAR